MQTTKIRPHWNYFLSIERELEVLARYVEFDAKNFECFSIEIARIVLSAGAEVDVVCKQLCLALNAESKADNINSYRTEILEAIPSLPIFEVEAPRFNLVFKPWDEWKEKSGVPLWWTAYNKIKHHRHTHYERANLKNALNAVAGLFIVVLYLYKQEAELGELWPSPQLLTAGPEHNGGVAVGGAIAFKL